MGTADSWSEGDDKLRTVAAALFETFHGLLKDPACHAAPTGVAGSHMTTVGIGQQCRRAVGSADPKTLAAPVAYQTVSFGPGSAIGLLSLEHGVAMDLLWSMHRDPRR